MIQKYITNTTYKKFIINWNIYHNDVLTVKTIHIPPKALNMEFNFADESDFESCKSQNALWFFNGDLIVGKSKESEAIEKNEVNAKENLKEAETKINAEVSNIQKQAGRVSSKKTNAKIDITTESAG